MKKELLTTLLLLTLAVPAFASVLEMDAKAYHEERARIRAHRAPAQQQGIQSISQPQQQSNSVGNSALPSLSTGPIKPANKSQSAPQKPEEEKPEVTTPVEVNAEVPVPEVTPPVEPKVEAPVAEPTPPVEPQVEAPVPQPEQPSVNAVEPEAPAEDK